LAASIFFNSPLSMSACSSLAPPTKVHSTNTIASR
jgi:hypothetical protein